MDANGNSNWTSWQVAMDVLYCPIGSNLQRFNGFSMDFALDDL